ncbi:hypothetical protein D3C87_1860520 [compost metagenome]
MQQCTGQPLVMQFDLEIPHCWLKSKKILDSLGMSVCMAVAKRFVMDLEWRRGLIAPPDH